MFSVNFPFICTKRGNLLLNTANCSGRSRPWDKGGGGRGGGASLQNKFFRPFRPRFGKKIRCGDLAPPGPFPGSTTELIHIARGIQMGHYCSLRKKSCTETKHVPMRSLFLWIRPQQRTTLLIVVNASYQWPSSLLKSSNYYYLTRVKLKKTCALSGESSLKTLMAIKKSKDPFSSLDEDGSSPMTGSSHGPRLGGSLGRGCCHSLEKGRGRAWKERKERQSFPFSLSRVSRRTLVCPNFPF